jgi:predicted DNA-binding transcriptional regulator YafY
MTSAQLLNVLSGFRGAARGVHMDYLAARTGVPGRELRKLISELRAEGVAICGTPTTGYFIAETAQELDAFCIKYLEARAMHSLRLSSRLRNIPLPILAGQLFINKA